MCVCSIGNCFEKRRPSGQKTGPKGLDIHLDIYYIYSRYMSFRLLDIFDVWLGLVLSLFCEIIFNGAHTHFCALFKCFVYSSLQAFVI